MTSLRLSAGLMVTLTTSSFESPTFNVEVEVPDMAEVVLLNLVCEASEDPAPFLLCK